MKTDYFKIYLSTNLTSIKEQRNETLNWLQSNGKAIQIKDMDINHIKNTLNLLYDKGSRKISDPYHGCSIKFWIKVFQAELIVRDYESLII